MQKKVAITVPEQTVGPKPAFEVKLWCGKCQRGITGIPNADIYRSGDPCPICVQNARVGRIKESEIESLKTCEQYEADHLRIAQFEREKRMRKIKAIKGADEMISQSEERTKLIIESQQKVIDDLTRKVESLIAKPKAKGKDQPNAIDELLNNQ